ncbi:MAG: hypothetical protein COY39_00115 [Alphaproteobacteria bacterium CG_4_10_14_0_8_um_filter_37_21]|nr:MAG: hypothetical protein COY39_00115 [Alphaproteobacteria bacterium CG_4_10_14_0_8_um_filter_37_21]
MFFLNYGEYMKTIKNLTVLGVFASASLMATDLGVEPVNVQTTRVSATTTSTMTAFLQVSDTKSLTEMQVGKVLDFASQLYRTKLRSLGFVRDLNQTVEAQCEEAKKYAKKVAGKLGISENEFNTLFKETETLLRKASIHDADETLKGILKICLRVSSKKMEERLTDAGVDPFIQDVLGIVATQGLGIVANKVSDTGFCGTVTHTLVEVLEANKANHEPSLET